MAELIGTEVDGIQSLRNELTEIGRSLRSSFRARASSFRITSSLSSAKDDDNEEDYIHWAGIEKLPTFERMRKSVLHKDGHGGVGVVVDVAELGAGDRQFLMEKLIKHAEQDNLKLLQKIRDRTERVGVKLPTIEVRYKNLCVEADCQIVHGNPLPTVWNFPKNSISGCANFLCSRGNEARISIIDGVSGIIRPGRMTLLLGPPGCGKTTFLKALSGNLHEPLKLSGEVSYNGYKLHEFVSQKTSAYISQYDLQLPQMTVRETLDFSAQCQGVGSREEIMMEVSRREKEAGIIPDPDVDTYMKGVAVKGLKRTLQTDYILKILGLDICADTLVGDAMRRGISGGQKKRLTTGEMVVGPNRSLFMDEITNGLDSTTAFQVVACLQHHARIMDATILVTLLQPAPETFDLFDDLILMAEGKIIYHGPRDQALKFFEDCGLKCPERKGAASFLQEVISQKDQAQYWSRPDVPYNYIPVNTLAKRFKESSIGMMLEDELSSSYDKSRCHNNALSFSPSSSLSKLQLLKVCLSRELLLMRRNSFVYIFKTCQLIVNASVMMTVFIRTQMSIDTIHANYYMGALYYAIVIHNVAGLSEMGMTLSRLAVFYKQKELRFYPAWAYAISTCILKIPVSLLQSVVWTCLTYYVVGYTPEVGRFFRQLIILFAMNLSSTSMFCFIASVSQTHVVCATVAAFSILLLYTFGGFLIAKPSMPGWLSWGFWLSPGTYTQIGLSLNEFLAPRWQKMLQTNSTIGHQTLLSRGLDFSGHMFWVSVGALFGITLLFNVGFVLALTFLKAPGKSRAIISHESYIRRRGAAVDSNDIDRKYEKTYHGRSEATNPRKDRVVLPFTPLTLVFENVHYYIDTPPALQEQGFTQKRFQLLSGITGAFRPGILTALMGITGAGKTTLLDVLSGRKTVGYIEGDIKVGGYPKVQETFSRISGYCEQTDVHSPQITIEESIIFSAGMRLDTRIDSKIRSEFVNEVLEITELDRIKDTLVGVPGVSGLSMEQRKRLTIAVELVANPSIIFMDEPTTGLDARAAAIIMRAVKNVVDTGRTIVCTIHQPSIDIFDSFNELVLLKSGGRIIYSGPVGKHSSRVIEYFESVPGVPKIRENYNPATWMLEVTSESTEAELGVDFAQIYKDSPLYQSNKDLVKLLSVPPTGSTDLHFPTRFAQSRWGQLKWCLWKQHWSYWRSPSYIWSRIIQTFVMSFIFGALLWDRGQKLDNQQKLFNILGALFIQVIFIGIANCSSVLSYVATERTVMYRERFAGIYNPWAYSLAQVAIEFPYLCFQAALFSAITYPMIGYYGSAYKIFWYFFGVLCSLLIYSCLGMTLVSVTPNLMVAEVLQSAFYTNFNLFAGFLVPAPRIPKWWIWVYYLCPTSWTLKALLTSQYGDIQDEIMVFGEKKTVAIFLKDYFGFHHDQLYITALALVILLIALASIFAISMAWLNFQKR